MREAVYGFWPGVEKCKARKRFHETWFLESERSIFTSARTTWAKFSNSTTLFVISPLADSYRARGAPSMRGESLGPLVR